MDGDGKIEGKGNPVEIKVIFEPEDKSVYVLPGTSILEAAAPLGIILDSACGGQGTCGKCRVQILGGNFPPTPAEKKLLSPVNQEKGWRLACQARIYQECRVLVPREVRYYNHKIMLSRPRKKVKLQSPVQKIYLRLLPPTLENPISDWENISHRLSSFCSQTKIKLEVMRSLPKILRSNNFEVTAVLINKELIALEPGNTTARSFGVAVDIGTTSLVAILVSLVSGEVLGISSALNPQVVWGEDVISRINCTINDSKALERLHQEIINAVNSLIEDLSQSAKVKPEEVYEIVAVGNTAMHHFFLGLPPRELTFSPFVPVLRNSYDVYAQTLKLKIHPWGNVHLLPNIAGFVGADTVGVILASSLDESETIKLAVDIGTNGEIVLGSRQRLLACSTAAGPAFEGAQISQGMRATTGAVEKVVFNQDVEINVIENVPPRGICGTGLIDTVAEMLRVGIIDKSGRIRDRGELDGKIGSKLLNRIEERKEGNRFFLTPGGEVAITQKDVRELQLAKAAIYAGIQILRKELKIEEEEISEVLLAGTFGNFIRRRNAQAIGLIPHLAVEKVRFIGNAAAEGARLALLSRPWREKSCKIMEKVEYIELSGRPDFQEEFMNAIFFPVPGGES